MDESEKPALFCQAEHEGVRLGFEWTDQAQVSQYYPAHQIAQFALQLLALAENTAPESSHLEREMPLAAQSRVRVRTDRTDQGNVVLTISYGKLRPFWFTFSEEEWDDLIDV